MTTALPVTADLHITVATTAAVRGLSLADELRLVKAALLYADSVTLASFTAGAIKATSSVFEGSEAQRQRVLLDVASVLMEDSVKDILPLLTQRAFRRKFPGIETCKHS